tara:strand:- start:479 stop:1024 length:546 start_codon:yes stop_codon:yes gene_type:complete
MAYKTDINKSVLNRNNFRLVIDKVPTVEYFVRTVNIPGVQFGETVQSAGVGLDAFFPGDKATFDTLEVSFIVDEDLGNFIEIYNWIDSIVPLSDPALYGSFTGTAKSKINQLQSVSDDLNQYSDITLVINTNKNIPNRYIRFHDCFPTALGSIELESGADAEPALVNVSFRFSYYDIADKS